VKRLSPALVALALMRCFPGDLDVIGLKCDANRSCGDGYTCFDDVCYKNGEVDAGPSNWLPNPGFEDLNDAGTNIAEWAGRTGKLQPYTTSPKSGLRAARIFSLLDGGETPSLQTQVVPVHDTFPSDTWCGLAWVRADTPGDAGVQVSVFLRERDDAGNQVSQNSAARVLVGAGWQVIEEKTSTLGAPNFDFRVQFVHPALPGQSVMVDDVALKHSPNTDCVWP